MRIMIYTHVYPDEHGCMGGIFIHNQAKALKKLGHEICVLFIDYRSLRHRRKLFFSSYSLEGIDVYRFSFPCGPISPVISIMNVVFCSRTYKYAINHFGKPDVVYSHFESAARVANRMKKKYGIPLVIMEHDSGLLSGEYREAEIKKKARTYDSCDALLVVGDALKQKVSELTNKNISIIPNIVPDNMFNISTHTTRKPFRFIAVGNLIQRKAFNKVIEAFSIVSSFVPEVELHIVGTGPEKENLEELIQSLSLVDKVFLRGSVNNNMLPILFGECNCFVMASRNETFGVVCIEALANGLPVIATACGGPEYFINNSVGTIVPVDDVGALASAMRRIIDEIDEFSATTISEYAYNHFSEDTVGREIEKIFNKVLLLNS